MVQMRVWSHLGSSQKNFQQQNSGWRQSALFPVLLPLLFVLLSPVFSPLFPPIHRLLTALLQRCVHLNDLLFKNRLLYQYLPLVVNAIL